MRRQLLPSIVSMVVFTLLLGVGFPLVVLGIGQQMARLTRAAGLRTMLKMMRRPAAAAGLGALQRFLECGFDTFAAMARRGGAEDFLGIIQVRESALMALLFDADFVACETELARILGQAP